MTHEEIEAFIARNYWKEAKSYAKTTPHEYCLYEKTPDKDEYNRFVAHIKANSVKEKFFKTYFNYFYHGEYKYFLYDPPNATISLLINRALTKYVYG